MIKINSTGNFVLLSNGTNSGKKPQPITSVSEIHNSNYSYKGFDAVIGVQWILIHLSRAFSWLNTGYVTEIHL